MSISNLGLLLAFISVVQGFRKYSPNDLDEEKGKDVGFCLGEIVCVHEDPEVVEGMMHAAEYPDLYPEILHAFSVVYGQNATDTKEWWLNIPKSLPCILTIAEQTYLFSEFAAFAGENFKKHNCEIEESERCNAYFKMLTAGEDIIEDYKEKGICSDENYAKRIAADQSKSQDVMKKMGFFGR